MKGSKIYVNKNALNNAIMSQNKQTTLARALMQIVFKDEALKNVRLEVEKENVQDWISME